MENIKSAPMSTPATVPNHPTLPFNFSMSPGSSLEQGKTVPREAIMKSSLAVGEFRMASVHYPKDFVIGPVVTNHQTLPLKLSVEKGNTVRNEITTPLNAPERPFRTASEHVPLVTNQQNLPLNLSMKEEKSIPKHEPIDVSFPATTVTLNLSNNAKSVLPLNEKAKLMTTGFMYYDDQLRLTGKNGKFVTSGTIPNRTNRSKRKELLKKLRSDEQRNSTALNQQIKALIEEQIGGPADP